MACGRCGNDVMHWIVAVVPNPCGPAATEEMAVLPTTRWHLVIGSSSVASSLRTSHRAHAAWMVWQAGLTVCGCAATTTPRQRWVPTRASRRGQLGDTLAAAATTTTVVD